MSSRTWIFSCSKESYVARCVFKKGKARTCACMHTWRNVGHNKQWDTLHYFLLFEGIVLMIAPLLDADVQNCLFHVRFSPFAHPESNKTGFNTHATDENHWGNCKYGYIPIIICWKCESSNVIRPCSHTQLTTHHPVALQVMSHILCYMIEGSGICKVERYISFANMIICPWFCLNDAIFLNWWELLLVYVTIFGLYLILSIHLYKIIIGISIRNIIQSPQLCLKVS